MFNSMNGAMPMPTKTQKTLYHLIVDKSGSMQDCVNQTINGFNEQINFIRQLENDFPEQEITIGLTLFNHQVDHQYFMQSPDSAYLLNAKSYRPGGSTSLQDAIGDSLSKLEILQQQSNIIMPTTVVVVIITDGHENSSLKYTHANVTAMIKRLELTEKWTFSFIGATLDAVEVAERMSIRRSNSFSFEKEEMDQAVWKNLNFSMKDYFVNKQSGNISKDLFKDDN